jgi:hypothetical protein
MLKQYEEIAVLEQGEDGAIVSIRGQGGPCVVVGPTYLGHLARIVQQAAEEVDRGALTARAAATRLLVSEIRTLLTQYEASSNKYFGTTPMPMSLARAMEELEELRKALNVEVEKPKAEAVDVLRDVQDYPT